MTRVHVLEDAEAVARHAANLLGSRIREAGEAQVTLHIALAGGSTPLRAYELLAQVEGSWAHVHLWLGDERCVPEGDPQSNARMIRDTLLAVARPQPPVFHVLQRPEQPEDAAWLYGLEILREVPDVVFDVVLLGMGPDGHTCSLFPGHPVLDVTEAPVAPVRDSPKPPPERVTLTLPAVRRARLTLLLVAGEDKSESLARALEGDTSIPLALLGDGLDEVVCDQAAGAELLL